MIRWILTPLLGLLSLTVLSVPALEKPICCSTATCQSQDQSQIEQEVVAPYVEVYMPGSGTGAGTVITLNGEVFVLTAAHVVDSYAPSHRRAHQDEKGDKVDAGPEDTVSAVISKQDAVSSFRIDARVVWFSAVDEDGGDDLALLKPASSKGLTPAVMVNPADDYHAGESTWYIGTPAGKHGRLEQSIVSIRDFLFGGKRWIGTNGSGYFGSSGGGLYLFRNGHYSLSGVVTRGDTSNPKGILLAITPSRIVRFLDAYLAHKRGKE